MFYLIGINRKPEYPGLAGQTIATASSTVKLEFAQSLGAEVIVGDLSQEDRLASAVAGVQTVVHLAAFFRGTDQERIKTTNEDGTLALANASLSAGVERFVFTSTSNVYGPDHSRPAREDDPPSGSSRLSTQQDRG